MSRFIRVFCWRNRGLKNDLPYNLLYDRGYLSIGCEPCTSIVEGDERAGRWNGSDKVECGIHNSKEKV